MFQILNEQCLKVSDTYSLQPGMFDYLCSCESNAHTLKSVEWIMLALPVDGAKGMALKKTEVKCPGKTKK
jgi:hypothetical protein